MVLDLLTTFTEHIARAEWGSTRGPARNLHLEVARTTDTIIPKTAIATGEILEALPQPRGGSLMPNASRKYGSAQARLGIAIDEATSSPYQRRSLFGDRREMSCLMAEMSVNSRSNRSDQASVSPGT